MKGVLNLLMYKWYVSSLRPANKNMSCDYNL